MKRILFIILLLISFIKVHAQEPEIDNNSDVWFTNNNWINLSDRVKFKQEIHFRSSEFLGEWKQILLRPSFHYKVNDVISFSGGYTKVWGYPYSRDSEVVIPEDNLWQELAISQKFEKSSLKHTYRYEQRWIGNVLDDEVDGRRFVNRLRYRVHYKRAIGVKGFYWNSYFELMVNVSDNYKVFKFNQHWTYLGAGKKVSDKMDIQLGFMRQYLRRSDSKYEDNIVTRINVNYTIF